jgi:hypothetical protein
LACHLQVDTDADPVPDPAHHFDADPDFYLMRMRIQVTKIMLIHAATKLYKVFEILTLMRIEFPKIMRNRIRSLLCIPDTSDELLVTLQDPEAGPALDIPQPDGVV